VNGKEGVTSSSLVPGFSENAADRGRAAQHGRSAEEERRQTLREALRTQGLSKSFKELLLEIPDVGEDRDFERPEDRGRPVELWRLAQSTVPAGTTHLHACPVTAAIRSKSAS
jgi:plasmid stability protein